MILFFKERIKCVDYGCETYKRNNWVLRSYIQFICLWSGNEQLV